jgi:two-component system response regulator
MADAVVDIVLVEDSEDDSAFFLHALREVDSTAHVRVARDGAAALTMIFGDQERSTGKPKVWPRVIFLDLMLPKVGGLEVLRILKSNPHTRTIPVVALSSSGEKRDLSEGYQLGANSYLVKPMDFDEFADMVQRVADYWLRLNNTMKH